MHRKQIQRKTPLRRVSPRRAEQNKKRRDLVAAELEKRPGCEAGHMVALEVPHKDRTEGGFSWKGCTHRATELHEPRTRARFPGQETFLDPAQTVAICRSCHRWVHGNPEAAERAGLLIPSWEPIEDRKPAGGPQEPWPETYAELADGAFSHVQLAPAPETCRRCGLIWDAHPNEGGCICGGLAW